MTLTGSLTRMYENYFNPNNDDKKLGDNAGIRDFYGFAGLALMATAAIAKVFFQANATNTFIIGASGLGFMASYATRKQGYAALVGFSALAGLAYATVDAVRSGRFFVRLDIDVAAILHEIRKSCQNNNARVR